MLDTHTLKMFDHLNKYGVTQFKSHLSASQYLLAYQLVNRYAKSGGTVLDWGTGKGHFSFFLLEQGFQVAAFTLGKPSTLSEYLSMEFPERYRIVADPQATQKLPFDDNAFDMVTSIGVLEHVRETGGNEIASLLEIERILKPGGIFFCYHFPNKYSWIEAIIKHIKSKYNHLYKYTRKEIENMLSATHLELVETKRYGLLPRLMFGKVPNHTWITNTYNALDRLLSKILPMICQNNYFIAKK